MNIPDNLTKKVIDLNLQEKVPTEDIIEYINPNTSPSTQVISIGDKASVTQPSTTYGLKRAIAIGLSANATGAASDGNEQCVAIGAHSEAIGEASMALGSQSEATEALAVAVGYRANA